MRPKVVTLRLDQVRRKNGCAIAVVVGNSGRERRNRDTILHGIRNHITQRLLIIVRDFLEVRCQQQVSDTRIFCICVGDFLQELCTNNAACTEDLRNFAVVQIPVIFVRSGTQLGEPLCVRDDLTEVERATDFLDKFRFVTRKLRFRSRQHFRRCDTLLFQRRDITCKNGFRDQRQRLAQIQRTLAGPFAGAFVCRFIQNHINQIFTLFILFGEDVFGDIDQVAVQLAFVPLSESLCQLFVRQIQATFQQRIGFCDQLHVAVFDTVVNHFHIVTGTIGTNIGHARFAIFCNCGNFSQNRRNQFVGFFLTARHDRWTFQRPFFTTGNTGTNEVKAFGRKFAITTDSVLEERVTTINDDVAFIQIRLQGIDSSISARPCFHH